MPTSRWNCGDASIVPGLDRNSSIMYHMDESRYGAGYRDALTHTLNHIQHRILEEKKWADEWHDKVEYRSYLRALEDTAKYLQWVLNLENK